MPLKQYAKELYTVVHLDQRGAGKTYLANPTIKPTLEMQLQDVHEVVMYLKERYHKEQIIILGHSWGSILGTIYTKRHNLLSEDKTYEVPIYSFWEKMIGKFHIHLQKNIMK